MEAGATKKSDDEEEAEMLPLVSVRFVPLKLTVPEAGPLPATYVRPLAPVRKVGLAVRVGGGGPTRVGVTERSSIPKPWSLPVSLASAHFSRICCPSAIGVGNVMVDVSDARLAAMFPSRAEAVAVAIGPVKSKAKTFVEAVEIVSPVPVAYENVSFC